MVIINMVILFWVMGIYQAHITIPNLFI